MKKITFVTILFILFGFFGSMFVNLEASTTVGYNVTGIFDSGGAWAGYNGSSTRGNTVSFDISSKPSGHEFAFWIVNGVVRKDLAATYEPILTTNNDFKIVFTPTGKVAAVFIDSSGKYIGVVYTEGGVVSDAALTMQAERPGFVVSSSQKWTSIEGSASISDVQLNSVFVLTYEEDETPLGAVTLSVTGGSASVANPVAFNTLVTVTADAAPTDQVFAGWEENGVIVSYNPQYKFSALYTRTLVATYAASVTQVPIVTMSRALGSRLGYFSYVGQYEVPAGIEVIEYGFIYHPTSTGAINIETVGIVVAQSYNRQTATNEFIYSFISTGHKSIRSYIIVDIEGTPTTFYGTNFAIGYFTDVDSGSAKGSYASGTWTASAQDWTLNQVLRGVDVPDKKIGTHVLRGRIVNSTTPGTATMLFNIQSV
jgi:hypothetical protein